MMYTVQIKAFGKWCFVCRRETLTDARTMAAGRLDLSNARIVCPDGSIWNAWGSTYA